MDSVDARAEPAANGDRSRVSADMEAIFGARAKAGGAVPASRSLIGAETPVPAPTGRRTALAAVIGLGAIAGGVLWGVPALRHESSPAPKPVEMTLSETPRPVLVAPPVATPAQVPTATPKQIPATAPTPIPAAPSVPVAASPAPVPKTSTIVPPKRTPTADRKAPSAEALDRAGRRGEWVFDDDTPSRGRCVGLSPRRRYTCLLDALARADERLRQAYGDAVSAGVDREDLLSRRARWTQLRRISSRRPAYVVASYDALAQELETLVAQR